MKFKIRLFLSTIIYLFHLSSFAQTVGLPFIKNYDPAEYNCAVQTQVWCAVQDKRGVMYFGNAKGVIEYDGTRWTTIETTGNRVVRSMDIDSSGRIYVGAVGEIGYLTPNINGKLHYNSLTMFLDSLDRNFNNVWTTVATSKYIYFLTDKQLIRFKKPNNKITKNDFKVWKTSATYFLLQKVNDKVLVLDRSIGLLEQTKDTLAVFLSNSSLGFRGVSRIFPYSNNAFLIATLKGLYVYNPTEPDENQRLTKKYFDAKVVENTDKFLHDNQLYYGIMLPDSTYALATLRNGVVIINKKTEIINHISKTQGLQSETVYQLYLDREDGLWTTLTYGISRMEILSPITQWNENTNLTGSIYNVINTNGIIYSGTNLGIYKRNENNFAPVPELTGVNALQCFSLANVSAEKSEKKLLVATINGIWEIKNSNAQLVNPLKSLELYTSTYDSSKVFFTNNTGIYSMTFQNEKWVTSAMLANLPTFASGMCEDKNNVLWIIGDNFPIRVNLNNNKDIRHFNNEKNLKDVTFNTIQNPDKEMVFLTSKGLYRFDEKNLKFYQDTLYLHLGNKNLFDLQKLKPNCWLVQYKIADKNKLMMITKTSNQFIVDSLLFNRIADFNYFYIDNAHLIWVVSSKALYQIDLNKKINSKVELYTLNRRVDIAKEDSVYFKGAYYMSVNDDLNVAAEQPETLKPNVEFKLNDLTFYFSLPSFDNESANRYSYLLEGYSEIWSDWSSETKKEFTYLPAGQYKFIVKAKNVYGIESKASEFEFTISNPWYKTIFAYIFYVALLIGLIYFIVRLYTYRLIRVKQRLERIVAKRTVEIKEKNVVLEEQKNDILEKNAVLFQQNEEIQAQAENMKEINNMLVEQNEEINQQKEEMHTINDQLTETNEELNNQTQELNKQHRLVVQQKNNITRSITYARRIQNAILPKEDLIELILPQNFIFYKPRDIVSGDFYFIKQVRNFTIIAVADCTGHGVPGAFMSMLGIATLNEIIRNEETITASKILNELRKQIKSALQQSGASGEQQDGMDIALCIINLETMELNFAGAYNPCLIFRKIENQQLSMDNAALSSVDYQLSILDADRMPVGIYLKERPFSEHTFQLKSGDTFYIYSDGYFSQFGGERKLPMKSKRFKDILKEICNLPMSEQKEILERKFNEWKTFESQTDDVLVMGIRI